MIKALVPFMHFLLVMGLKCLLQGWTGRTVGMQLSPWQSAADAKRTVTAAKIPSKWLLPPTVLETAKSQRILTGNFIEELLDMETLRITNLDTEDIIASVSNGSLSSVQVTTAFCKRASFAHQINGNLLEILFDLALEQAAELDKHLAEHRTVVGPLHGLPVSVKDQFHVKGGETTMGYVGWIGTFEGQKGTGLSGKVDSEIIKELRMAGAIPIAKTSPTQTLWCGETNNNILGYNWNPHNTNVSSGGSSGGQGSFQALRGTTFGLGTDVGGSISMPAAFNGLYSIKPSNGRLPFKGVPNSSAGQPLIPTVVALMASSLEGLRLGLEALVGVEPWKYDSQVIRLPWNRKSVAAINQKSRRTGLHFGILDNDGVVSPHPPIARAMRLVRTALAASGHKLTQWNPPSHTLGLEIHGKIVNADGGLDIFERLKLSGEPIIPELQDEYGYKPKPAANVLQFYSHNLELEAFRNKYQEYWLSTSNHNDSETSVDAVISPVAPHAAVLPGKWFHYAYSTIANILDVPTIVIPVTFANSTVDIADKHREFLSVADQKNWEAYDSERYHGAPASIQIIGKRLQEEDLLAIARIVVEALRSSDSN